MPQGRSPGFNETCESCGKDLHACLNCRFYKPGAHWDCSETVDQAVVDKEARNYCDYFQTNPAFFAAGAGRKGAQDAAQKARGDLDRLFGG